MLRQNLTTRVCQTHALAGKNFQPKYKNALALCTDTKGSDLVRAKLKINSSDAHACQTCYKIQTLPHDNHAESRRSVSPKKIVLFLNIQKQAIQMSVLDSHQCTQESQERLSLTLWFAMVKHIVESSLTVRVTPSNVCVVGSAPF